MRSLPRAKMPGDELSGREVVVLAAALSFPVIGLDHLLRTSPGQFYAQPETEIAHWIADSMMALLPVPPRPHAIHSSPPRLPASGPSVTAAPYAFAYTRQHMPSSSFATLLSSAAMHLLSVR